MAASLDQKQVEDFIERYRAVAQKEQRRVNELEECNEHLVGEILSSLIVPTSAFGLSYARAYFGERASIFGIPIDAMVGMLLKGFAALLGVLSDKGAQSAAKVAHDVANGAIASWSANAGAALGLKKRMEKPLPAPQPNTGATEMSPHSSRPMTHEDLAAIKASMAVNTQPVMLQQSSAPSPLPAPALPSQPFNGQPAPIMTSAIPDLPPTPQRPFRFTQRWAVDPEADMRALLQSVGAPSDPNAVNHLLRHENPGDELKVILQRARAPA